ncbi:MAG: T9SS type A sorting domain-containing protein [Bacteroidales bacterium]|nr:T9SS type A sorting domain-containing protein [Bacteroidales bacterium]
MIRLSFAIFIVFAFSHAYSQNESSAYLDLNNIKALLNSNGALFTNGETSEFEVPKGSGKSCLFNSGLWIAGKDQDQTLHFAGMPYYSPNKQVSDINAIDFFSGPISELYNTEYDNRWNTVWKITQQEIDYHKEHWNDQDYLPIEVIESWPAHGILENGETYNIAPFYDSDNDNMYDPVVGDHPIIRGDQAIFYVINDIRNEHIATESLAMGIQLHVMAYAFDDLLDADINNTIFLHYDILNRSENSYDSTYIGISSDFDIGHANDDYVGSDVKQSSFYGYNALEVDGTGQSWSYGDNPPALSTTILAGPFLVADEIDNAAGQLDFSYNGFGFEDDIIDNERMGLSSFMVIKPSTNLINYPISTKYYNFMQAKWADSTHLVYGGNGHIDEIGSVGPECHFMFPGNSDLTNFGTDGIIPNDGYNQDDKFWTEQQTENNPYDVRGIGSCGPFTFNSGGKQELDIAYIFAQSDNYLASVDLLRDRISSIRHKVKYDDIIYLPNHTLGSQDKLLATQMQLFPNPANDKFRISISEELFQSDVKYAIYDNTGSIVKSNYLTEESITVSDMNPGIYYVKVYSDQFQAKQKLVIIR